MPDCDSLAVRRQFPHPLTHQDKQDRQAFDAALHKIGKEQWGTVLCMAADLCDWMRERGEEFDYQDALELVGKIGIFLNSKGV